MKYVPKTTAKMREKAVGYGYGYSKNTAVAIITDLTSCESCLAEAEREVERLRQEILGCIRLIPTKFVVRDFSERRTEECIEGTLAISISRLNAELVKCQDAQQLLNSEGRAGT